MSRKQPRCKNPWSRKLALESWILRHVDRPKQVMQKPVCVKIRVRHVKAAPEPVVIVSHGVVSGGSMPKTRTFEGKVFNNQPLRSWKWYRKTQYREV